MLYILIFFFNTVKTRRDRLKQPKFVLRCVQLMVGLACPIGLKAIQRVPKTSPARATARSGIWTSADGGVRLPPPVRSSFRQRFPPRPARFVASSAPSPLTSQRLVQKNSLIRQFSLRPGEPMAAVSAPSSGPTGATHTRPRALHGLRDPPWPTHKSIPPRPPRPQVLDPSIASIASIASLASLAPLSPHATASIMPHLHPATDPL